MEKEIIIMAKSSKKNEYCVAGIDVETGEWVRPVSDNEETEGAVPGNDLTLKSGEQIEVLDKVIINFVEPLPKRCQPENILYNNDIPWVKTGHLSLSDLIKQRNFDSPNIIFYNSDKEVESTLISGQTSLLFLEVQKPYVFVWHLPNKIKVQLCFDYKGQHYDYFQISDQRIKSRYLSKGNGSYYDFSNKLCVVLSLTDIFMGKHYKMVAHIFE